MRLLRLRVAADIFDYAPAVIPCHLWNGSDVGCASARHYWGVQCARQFVLWVARRSFQPIATTRGHLYSAFSGHGMVLLVVSHARKHVDVCSGNGVSVVRG